jgi:hypothetical protein
MEKEESGSETSKSVLHDEKSDDTVSRGDNTDENMKSTYFCFMTIFCT